MASADQSAGPSLQGAGPPLSERFFAHVVARRRLFVDIGAGEGRSTVLALRASPQLEAIVVEPTEVRREWLRGHLGGIGGKRAEVVAGEGGGAPEGGLSIEVVAGLLAGRASGPTAVRFGPEIDAARLLAGMASELSRREDPLLWLEIDPRTSSGCEAVLPELIEAGWKVFAIDDRRGLFRTLEGPRSAAFLAGEARTLFCVRAEQALDVCFFSHAASLNGAERSLLDIVRFGIRHADLVATVVLPGEGPLVEELSRAGAACVVAPFSWWCDSRQVEEEAARERMLTSAAVILEEVVPLLEEVAPSVVLTSSLVIPWGAVAAARLRLPHVWYVKEFGERDHGLHFFEPFHEVLDTIRRSSDLVLTVSEAVRTELFDDLPQALCRTAHSYIELPPDDQRPSAPYFRREGAFRLGNFHTLTPGKGQATLIQAVAELTRRGHDVELLLAGGSDEEYRREIEELIAQCGLSDRVHIEGFLENPYPAMVECDALTLSSRCEAYARAALEGALLGRPLIYPASGGYLESMRDRETGLAYPPGDAAALADRIETLLLDPDLVKALGEQARTRARQLVAEARPDRLLLPLLREAAGLGVPAGRASVPGLRRLTSVRLYLLHQRREAVALRAVEEELQRQIENLLGVSARASAIETRLQAVEEAGETSGPRPDERRPGRPEVDRSTPEGAKRLERLIHHLQDSIDHLAADGAELRRQMAAAVTLLELRRDSGGVLAPLAPSRAPAGGAPALARRLLRPAKRVLRPGYRMARVMGGRMRRAALRRLPARWVSRPEARDEVRLAAGPPRAVPSPALSVVIPVDRFEAAELEGLLDRLARQTVTSVEWVLWSEAGRTVEVREPGAQVVSRAQAVDGAALRESLGGAYVVTAGRESGALPLTWLETASWSALAEDLPVVRLACEDSTGRRVLHPGVTEPREDTPADLLVVRRDLWAPDGLDVGALARLASGRPRVLGRVVRHVGDFADCTIDLGALLPGEANKLVRRSGDHLVQARLAATVFHHTIYPLDEILPEEPVDDPRRSVLILVPFLAIGGAEKLTYDLMRQVKDRFRFIIVTLAPHDPTFGNRLEEFRQLTPHVYTLGETFVQPLLFSVLSHLIRKFQVQTLFNANGTTWFYEALSSLRSRFPKVTIVNQLFDHREGWIEYYGPDVVHCCDIHLATNAAIEVALLHEHRVPGSRVRHIPHGIDLNDFRPDEYSPDRIGKLRDELGVPREAVLVTMAVRMHPQKRPEDFVALAHELADDKSLFFLLVGGGPLDGSVQDLVKYYGVKNLRRLGFYTPISDLLAISDVACMMSEYEALPLFILSALAMETPVVATDVGAIASVLRQGPCGIVISRVGDLGAFRSAICSLKDPRYRRDLGTAGRAQVEAKFAIETAAEEYARVFSAPPATSQGAP